MEQYIGVKLIWAEPAYRCSDGRQAHVIVKDGATAFANYSVVEDGYYVCCAEGDGNWMHKDVFEEVYLPLLVNYHLKTDKPSISQEMVDDFIAEYDVITMGDKCTVVKATLRNGFEIVESSACVSPENYDEKLGAEICMEKIRDKVWMLLGFLLQTAVYGINFGKDGATA